MSQKKLIQTRQNKVGHKEFEQKFYNGFVFHDI